MKKNSPPKPPKLVHNNPKVVKLRDRPPSVENIIRDLATNDIEYKRIMVIAVTKDDYVHAAWSRMKHSERVFLADFAKHIALEDIQ